MDIIKKKIVLTKRAKPCIRAGALPAIPQWEYYGFANGWQQRPVRVTNCQSLKHAVRFNEEGKSITVITCDKCNYGYKIDSSG